MLWRGKKKKKNQRKHTTMGKEKRVLPIKKKEEANS